MSFKAPPEGDFEAYAKLVDAQRSHYTKLADYGATQCSNGSGLDGLLYPLRGPITTVSTYFHNKFELCANGMTTVSDRMIETGQDYHRSDRTAADRLAKAYPAAPTGFHEISGGALIGSFDDHDVTLTEPASAETDTQKNISLELKLASGKLIGGELKGAEKVFKFLTGQSLVELLLTPLVGTYGRLKYLAEAYEQLGTAAYGVAANLRRGTWRMGGEWDGEAATAFEAYLFRWHMGTGGLGDAAKVASKAFHDGYIVVCGLVLAVLKEINTLLEDGVKKLAEEAAEMAAGDVAIEAVGLGPEDPLADIGAGIFTAYKMYKIYKTVRTIISVISAIESTFEAISKAVDGIGEAVTAIETFMNTPTPSLDDIKSDVVQRGATFEQDGFWNAEAGSTRIGLLPSA